MTTRAARRPCPPGHWCSSATSTSIPSTAPARARRSPASSRTHACRTRARRAAAARRPDGTGVNGGHDGDPALDTADWRDDGQGPGNLRVDYVLPSADLEVTAAGVFWPAAGEPLADAAATASAHRLVWVDLVLP